MRYEAKIISLQALLEEYFFSRVLRKETEKTYRKIISKLEDTLDVFNQRGYESDIQQLDRHILLEWRRQELNKGLSPTSWNTYIRHLKAVFNYGIDQGLLTYDKNPFAELTITVPKKKKKTLDDLVIVQTRHLLNQLQAQEEKGEYIGKALPVWFWRVVFETFYYSGIRRNQLVHLQVKDIDLKTQQISIRVEGSKTWREYPIPICNNLLPWLKLILLKAKQLDFKREDQLFNVNRYSPRKRYNSAKELSLDRLSNVFEYISKTVGARITPHRFRHTLGTELMKTPERDLHLVKSLMGHTNIRTTLEYVEADMASMKSILENRRIL